LTWYPRRRADPVKLFLHAASRSVLIQFHHDHGDYALVTVTNRIAVVHFLPAPNADAAHSQYFDLPAGLHDGRAWNLIELVCFVEEL
jgi:hypothetical protein